MSRLHPTCKTSPTGRKTFKSLKTPYRDGTTHVIFEPLDFIARLAALVPKPRANLTRYHGVFAPNSRDRAAVTPAKRGKGAKPAGLEEEQEKTPAQRRAALTPDQVRAGSGRSASNASQIASVRLSRFRTQRSVTMASE